MNNEAGDFATSEPADTSDLPSHDHDTTGADAPGRRISLDTPRSWARKKRLDLLDDLIRNLDILAYAEIATVYYLDNSFLRFALRSIVQLVYLMPRSSILPEPPQQPYIGGIIGTNFFCLFCHAWFARPAAGEATRGYMHGGLLLDFVGQLGPSSKLRLVLLDLGILLLQLVALAATVKRRALNKGKNVGAAGEAGTSEESGVRQDHDAEERGVIRQPPSPSSSHDVQDTAAADSIPRSRPSSRTWAMADLLASGQTVIAELYIWDTLRDQHNAYANRTLASSSATSALSPELAAALRTQRWQLNVPFRS